MRLRHRAAHRLLWPVLALVIALGFAAALIERPPIPIETSP
ncbi:MAG TPA: hypothetical protein VL993_08865 [Stellaceae bacterium]|nr:hypothetical protein [Stellaceae bacterium]